MLPLSRPCVKCVVILSVVENNNHPSIGSETFLAQLLEEGPAALGLKFVFLPCVEELAVTQSYGSEIANAFSRWLME